MFTTVSVVASIIAVAAQLAWQLSSHCKKPEVRFRLEKDNRKMVPQRFLCVSDFCDAYGLARSVTYERIASGDLRAVKFGRRTLIDIEAAERFMSTLPDARGCITCFQPKQKAA